MALNFFVHFVDDVAAAAEPDWAMVLHSVVVRTLVDFVVVASPIIDEGVSLYNLIIGKDLPWRLERNAITVHFPVSHSCC